MTKFEKLANEVKDLIIWANGQGHINYDASNILLDNLESIIKEIEKE